MPLRVAITWEPLETIASELTSIRRILARYVGWPQPPDPKQIPTIQPGVESPMGIQVVLTPTDISLEPFSDDGKAEISQWQFTPFFDGIPQEPIRGDKASLDPVTIVVPEGVQVYAEYRWVDNSGNVSLNSVQTPVVMAADLTPPDNPTQVPGIAVGDEVPDTDL